MVLKVVKTNVSPWTTVTFTPKFTNLLYIHSLPSPFAHSFCHYLCAWLVNHRIRDWHLSPSIHHFPICLQHSASLIYQVSFHSTPTATLSVTEHGLVLLFLFFLHISHQAKQMRLLCSRNSTSREEKLLSELNRSLSTWSINTALCCTIIIFIIIIVIIVIIVINGGTPKRTTEFSLSRQARFHLCIMWIIC